MATILQQAQTPDGGGFHVSGVGLWHPGDTYALAAMVDPHFNVGKTPHRLSTDSGLLSNVQPPHNVKMYNLAGTAGDPVIRVGTIRAIRIYENTPGGTKLRQRFDWELPLSATDHASIGHHTPTTLRDLFDRREQFEYILVKDLRKGAIDLPLIKKLSHEFANAKWYISSKEWRPDWMQQLKKSKVALIIIPQTAARRAITRGAIASSWLTFGGVPSQEALAALGKLGDEHRQSRIVVLPNDHTILVFDRDGNGDPYGFIHSVATSLDTVPFTPMASVFFPAMVAQLALGQRQSKSFYSIVHDAVHFTQRWQADEGQRLTREDWKPGAAQILELTAPTTNEPVSSPDSFRWSEATEQWDHAFSNIGIVNVSDPARPGETKEEFQLWRGMTELGEYVACTPRKRLALSYILREARRLFRSPHEERRHRSFLFVDSPGAGKSFMVKCLRKALEIESKQYNITRLRDKDDLFAVFQDIAAARSDACEPILIFIDELNAKINDQHVYEAFLEPLEDGKYVRAGSVGTIDPCLWIFAGTEDPSKSETSSKGDDLVQRLSHPVFHFRRPGDDGESDILNVENLYVGVACVLQRFPEVKRISKRVLQIFRDEFRGKVPREVRRFIWDIEEVQYSRVTTRNLPPEWHQKHGTDSSSDDESALVEIKTRPND